MPHFTFTVFTPTYNRAHTLPRVYESLCAQTFRDFEWLVVDDGSTDGTENLVRRWQAEADFPIRYIWKENGGKHTAHNVAIIEARGRYFQTLDSDDACVPQALERLLFHWNTIPVDQQPGFSAVTALCMDEQGRIVGTPFPTSPFDSNSLETTFRYKMRGDKWGFQRTDVVRQFPFPELGEPTGYLPEPYVWTQIARRYQTRYVNEPLRIYHTDTASILRPAGSKARAAQRRALGAVTYYRYMLSDLTDYAVADPIAFGKGAIQYVRHALHRGWGYGRQWREVRGWRGRLLWMLGVGPGTLYYLKERRELRQLERGAA